MAGLLSAIVGNGHIKFSLQRSHSTINLFRCYLLISHAFQSHGSVSDSKKSYLSMLNRMNFGNSYTDLILYCCCWGFALYYESSDLYLSYGTSLSEQSSSTTCLRELKFKPSLFKKGVNKHFFKSQPNTHSLHLHVTLQKFMMCDSELKDPRLCSRKLIPFFLWCCWGYSTIILLSSACSPKHDSEGANNSHRTEQFNFCCHIGKRE